MNKREYAEYLAHPEWASKKEKLFRILGRKCSRSGCGISTSLQIHHKTYMLGKLPWEYSPENFEVLCRKHHCEAHAIYYVENKCWDCGKVIPESFEMCIPCKNKAAREQALDIEQVKGDLERLKVKVVTVEGGQSQTSSNKNKEQALDIQQVKGGSRAIERYIHQEQVVPWVCSDPHLLLGDGFLAATEDNFICPPKLSTSNTN